MKLKVTTIHNPKYQYYQILDIKDRVVHEFILDDISDWADSSRRTMYATDLLITRVDQDYVVNMKLPDGGFIRRRYQLNWGNNYEKVK